MPTETAQRLEQRVHHRLLAKAARAIASTLGLLLLPKCPLCIAGYLVSFGLGTSAAAFAAPLLRPLGWLLVSLACAALTYSAWRQARARRAEPNRRSTAECCCD